METGVNGSTFFPLAALESNPDATQTLTRTVLSYFSVAVIKTHGHIST